MRRQLERWEPIVAEHVRRLMANRQLDGADVWAAATEHHFALVAARSLLRALDLPPASNVAIDPTVRSELAEGRDLHEHWPENLPIFNVTPRPTPPRYPSGRSFAARNPNVSPYMWLHWTNQTGALLLPHVPAPVLHQILDVVQADVLAQDAALSAFVPPRAPSPWLHQEGTWWPKAHNG